MALVELEREGGVAVLTLNRPERLNAIDRELLRLLSEHVVAVADDATVRCLVVTGAGERAFSAGADVLAFEHLTAAEAYELMRVGQDVYQTLEDFPGVTIGALNGYALGGGLELALACDFRVATARAQLGQPEISLANLPGWGGTQRLPCLVGEPVAKDLILTGRRVAAAEALALGLVHRVTDGSALEGALALARELSARSPAAMTLAKRAIHAARPGAQEDGYELERLGVAHCFTTPEQQEAVARFARRAG